MTRPTETRALPTPSPGDNVPETPTMSRSAVGPPLPVVAAGGARRGARS